MQAAPRPLALANPKAVVPFSGVGIPRHCAAEVDQDVWSSLVACCESGDAWPLTLVGDVGTGKTCAALSLLDFVIGQRSYFTVATLCEHLIAVQKGEVEYAQKPDTPRHWWRRYREAACVVIDELGARERVSDYQYETVKRAIDERTDAPAVFISNLTLDQLTNIYDDRIASRLAAGTVVEIESDDRRLQ